MKRILITGSEGFIGKALSERLDHLNYDLVCIDKKNGQDLCDYNYVKTLPDVEIIFHLAAFNGTKWFYEKPFDVVLNNTEPTLNLLKRYAKNIDLFVFAGTCESYAGSVSQNENLIPTKESVPLSIEDVLNPRWSYGGSKIGNEVSVIAARQQFDMNYQILRFHNIYGPNQKDHFFSEFISRIRKGDYSLNGFSNTRSFLYIDDAIDYVYELMNNKKAYNEIVNIGSDDEISIKDAAEIIMEKLKIDKDLILRDAPEGSVKRRLPDTKKLKSFCEKSKNISLAEGIKKVLEN